MMVHDETLVPDFGACLAVISDDLAARSSPAQALGAIRLLLLANDWCLRAPACADAEGALSAWPGTAFAPVALTPDELGAAWEQGRPRLAVEVMFNGQPIGRCDAGTMTLHFGQLLAQLCRTRALRAGTVLGCGPLARGLTPTACPTPGDRVRVEAKGRDGQSLFGAIEQIVALPG